MGEYPDLPDPEKILAGRIHAPVVIIRIPDLPVLNADFCFPVQGQPESCHDHGEGECHPEGSVPGMTYEILLDGGIIKPSSGDESIWEIALGSGSYEIFVRTGRD